MDRGDLHKRGMKSVAFGDRPLELHSRRIPLVTLVAIVMVVTLVAIVSVVALVTYLFLMLSMVRGYW